MKTKRIITILLIAILTLSLVGCGNGGSKASPAGTYTLTAMTENGEPLSQEDLDMLSSLGLSVSLIMNEDGTGSIQLFGEEKAFTWKGTTLTMDGVDQEFEFDGTTIIIKDEGSELTFTKDEATEETEDTEE